MKYSAKEMNWILKQYNKARSWKRISAKHDKKECFPQRRMSALQVQLYRWLEKN
jgi:hypothetical protein